MSDQLSDDLASLRIDRSERERPEATRASRSLVLRSIVWVIALGLLVTGVLYAYPHVEARIFRTEVQITEVLRISPARSATSFTSTGYVVAEVLSRVSAKTPGRIAQIHIDEGDIVTEGQVIAELDASEAESAVLAARSRLLAARARIATAKATLAEIELQARRQRGLVESGASPRATLDDLLARAASAKAAVHAAEAEAAAMRAEAELARVTRDDLIIEAPIGGMVITEPLEVGEAVPLAAEIVQIADMSTLVIETDVPESRLALVVKKGPTEIVLDAFPGRRYRGEVLEVGRRVNRAKATVPVKVRFVDAPDGVLPDMSARVSFLTEALTEEQLRAAEKVVIPKDAVVTRGGRKVVFVIEDGAVRAENVTLGPRTDDGFELVDGPDPGTRLVANPPSTLESGQKIKEGTE